MVEPQCLLLIHSNQCWISLWSWFCSRRPKLKDNLQLWHDLKCDKERLMINKLIKLIKSRTYGESLNHLAMPQWPFWTQTVSARQTAARRRKSWISPALVCTFPGCLIQHRKWRECSALKSYNKWKMPVLTKCSATVIPMSESFLCIC